MNPTGNFRQHFAQFALLTTALLLGTGCGPSSSPTDDPDSTPPTQTAGITNSAAPAPSILREAPPAAINSPNSTTMNATVVPPLLPKEPPNIVILPPPSRLRQNPAIMRDARYQALIASVFDQPFRQIGTNVFDFRPLKFAIQNGAAAIENQFGMWRVLLFQVQELHPNGVLVRLDQTYHGANAPLVFVHHLQQNHLGLTPASQLATLAVETNSFELNVGGVRRAVPAYEAGIKPDPALLETVNELAEQQAAGRIAAAKQQQEAMEAGRKMAADERRKSAEQRKLSFLKDRALSGSASSQYRLALLHLSGEGVEKDVAEANRLLKLSAAQGYNQAVRKLADLEK